MTVRTIVGAGCLLAGILPAAHGAPPTTDPLLLPDTLAAYREARMMGGPVKDGIPSVDKPRFQPAADAGASLDDQELVIGVYLDGEARAYPRRILVWHEIVNDRIGDRAVAVTYCPLTGTALGFHRNGTELGVSGKLVNSNLVMYDRATDTEYPQILGAGIDGPLAGSGLREFRVFWTDWGSWRQRHPDTRVLTTETGYMRNYQRDPYGGYNPRTGYYAESSGRMFPVLHEDERYAAKRVVLGFRDRKQAVAVDKQHLHESGVVHHAGPGGHYVIIHDPELDTGWVYRGDQQIEIDAAAIELTADGPRFPGRKALTQVNAFEAMWFAWAAFYPGTTVIDG